MVDLQQLRSRAMLEASSFVMLMWSGLAHEVSHWPPVGHHISGLLETRLKSPSRRGYSDVGTHWPLTGCRLCNGSHPAQGGVRVDGSHPAQGGVRVDGSHPAQGGVRVDGSHPAQGGVRVDGSHPAQGGVRVDGSHPAQGGVRVDGSHPAQGGVRVDGGLNRCSMEQHQREGSTWWSLYCLATLNQHTNLSSLCLSTKHRRNYKT